MDRRQFLKGTSGLAAGLLVVKGAKAKEEVPERPSKEVPLEDANAYDWADCTTGTFNDVYCSSA